MGIETVSQGVVISHIFPARFSNSQAQNIHKYGQKQFQLVDLNCSLSLFPVSFLRGGGGKFSIQIEKQCQGFDYQLLGLCSQFRQVVNTVTFGTGKVY